MFGYFFRSFSSTKTELEVNITGMVSLYSQRAAEHHHAKHGGFNRREPIKAIFLDERRLSKFEGSEYLRIIP